MLIVSCENVLGFGFSLKAAMEKRKGFECLSLSVWIMSCAVFNVIHCPVWFLKHSYNLDLSRFRPEFVVRIRPLRRFISFLFRLFYIFLFNYILMMCQRQTLSGFFPPAYFHFPCLNLEILLLIVCTLITLVYICSMCRLLKWNFYFVLSSRCCLAIHFTHLLFFWWQFSVVFYEINWITSFSFSLSSFLRLFQFFISLFLSFCLAFLGFQG